MTRKMSASIFVKEDAGHDLQKNKLKARLIAELPSYDIGALEIVEVL